MSFLYHQQHCDNSHEVENLLWARVPLPSLLVSLVEAAMTLECLEAPVQGGRRVRKAERSHGGPYAWWGHRGCGGSVTAIALGMRRGAAAEQSTVGSQQWQPAQQMLASCWKRHVCGSLCVWGTPRGRGGQGDVFRSPVIHHNAEQIRLELTAEDIQLDCACHSVASIRVSAHAFVFAFATREHTACSVFLCHFHLCRPLALDFFISFNIECYMLNIDSTGACKFLIYIVHFSDAITLPDLKNPSAARWQIKTEFFILKCHRY